VLNNLSNNSKFILSLSLQLHHLLGLYPVSQTTGHLILLNKKMKNEKYTEATNVDLVDDSTDTPAIITPVCYSPNYNSQYYPVSSPGANECVS